METLLAMLCGLTLFVFFVAVAGYAMWATFSRVLSTGGSPNLVSNPCPRCGARAGFRDGRCLNCGGPPPATAGALALREELTTTARQLKRFREQGLISQQQYDDLAKVIADQLAPPAETPPPAPVVAPVPPPSTTPPPIVAAPVLTASAAPSQPEVVEAILVAAPVAPARPVHPLDSPVISAPPRPPARPGRPLADVLQSFMEESNIRWGEILAATLIVLCSVGLVISLRNTLKNIPYFPAILFTSFTVAFHGAGMYTLRRWNLQAVSRVILIISLLLVPLTFSGAVVLSGSGEQQRAASDPLFLLALVTGMAVFTWVCFSAGRELVGRGAWPLTIGVLGCSLSQVLIQRVELAGVSFLHLMAVAGIPIGSFLVASGWQILRARRWQQLSQRRVSQILLLLGIAVFALLAPLALLLVRGEPRGTTLARLSPLLSMACAAIMALGLLIHRRTVAARLSAWQTAGTAILVLGGVLLVALAGCAWPEPELLLAVGVINGVILTVLGVISGLPLLYVPAVACAALAITMTLHLMGGHFADREQLTLRMVQALLMGRTSVALTLLLGGVAGMAAWLVGRQRRDDAGMLLVSTVLLAGAAIFIALFSGFVPLADWPQDRDLASAVLLLYAVALLVAGPALRWPGSEKFAALEPATRAELDEYFWPVVTSVGSWLLWTALVQGLLLNSVTRGWLAAVHGSPARPILVATLVHGLIAAVLSALAARRRLAADEATFKALQRVPRFRQFGKPLAVCAAVSLVAIIPFVVAVRGDQFHSNAALSLWAAVGFGLLVAAQRWQWAVSGLQGMCALAAALVIAGMWKAKLAGPGWLVADQHLLAQLMAAAIGAMVWSAIRRPASESQVLRGLLNAPWPAVDQLLLGVAAIGLPVVAMSAVLPAVGWELGFDAGTSPSPVPAGESTGPLGRGWIALAVVVAALAVSLWERVSFPAMVGVGVATWAAVWLTARHFEPPIAAASAARWAAAIYAVVWGAVYILRDSLRMAAKQLSWLRWSAFPAETTRWFCAQPLLLGGATVLILTIIAVIQNASGVALRGPAAESIFARLGATASYAGPLFALVAVMLAYAVRDRQAGFALGGMAVSQLAINLAFLLYLSTSAAQPATVRTIEWLQWNSVAAGLYSLVWLGLSRWITPASADSFTRQLADALWAIPVTIGGTLATALVVWAAWIIAASPAAPPAEIGRLGGWLSYLALGTVLAAVVCRARGRLVMSGLGDAAFWLAAGLAVLLATTLHRYDAGGQWIAYHALEAGWLVVAAAACGLVCWNIWQAPAQHATKRLLGALTPHHISALMLMGLVVALSIRGNRRDPGQPWWSLAATLGPCGIAAAVGLARRSQPYAYISTALAGLVVLLFAAAPATLPWLRAIFGTPIAAVLDLIAAAMLLAAMFWLVMEIRWQRQRGESLDPAYFAPRVHAATCGGWLGLLFLWQCVLLIPAGRFATAGAIAAPIAALVTLGGSLFLSLWDRRAWWAILAIYAWGVIGWILATNLVQFQLLPTWHLAPLLLLAVSLHVALTGQTWSYGANLAALGTRLGIADPIGGLVRTAKWLPGLNLSFAAGVCLVALPLVLNLNSLPERVAAAWGPAVVAWGVLCLAQERRRDALQLVALLVAGLTAVYLAWAQLDPQHTPELWLTRVFRLLMVLAALTFLYGLMLPRFLLTAGSWNAATRQAGYIAGAAAMATFVVTLGLEAALFQPGVGAPVADLQVVAIAVVLVGLIAGLISMALLPGRDPLVLTEQGRQGYVYAAQAVAALLFAHVYICKPFWFDSVLRPYWPFLLMGLAFLGVGAAELFQRFGVRVLAEPLARTGGLLPLLPVIGWWVASSQADYALLLFGVGLLYLALSWTRKSAAAMIAATVAGNGALWAFLADTQGFRFAEHPQFWLIPPALSVLAAAQINRHRLAPEMLAAIRYAAMIVIYVSSTSEIFIRGIGQSLVPPMILMLLAVAGTLAGIAFRVRAFLFLGMTFTLLALVSMVAHAARSIEHVWPWWVLGISLGVAVLVLLGVFEKRRDDVNQLIARLREWEI